MGSLDSGFYKVICSCCHQNNLEKDFDISKTLGTILDCKQSTIRLDKVNSINTLQPSTLNRFYNFVLSLECTTAEACTLSRVNHL